MKNKKVIILSLIGVVLFIATVLGVLYFTTDLFKTNQQLFYKYISEVEIIDTNFIEQYEKANKKTTGNSYSSVANLDVSTAIPNQDTGVSDMQKILTVKSNGLENSLLKQSYRDFIFSSNNKNFLTIKYLRDDNTYGITADNILAKYLAVENSNLRELYSKLGISGSEDLPDSIPTNYEEILEVDKEVLAKLSETYMNLIYDNINEGNFYKTLNEDKTETIGVALSQQEFFNISKVILETANNDTVLLNLIINKAQLLGYNNITIEDVQNKMRTYIEDVNKGNYSTEKDFLKLALVKKDKQVIKLQIENKKELSIYEKQESIENNVTSGITPESLKADVQGKTINSKYIIDMDFSEQNKIILSIKENENEIFKSTINYSYDNNNIKVNTDIFSNQDGETTNTKMQYEINNYQSENISQNIIVDMMINNEENYQINLANNITLKQDVQISKLTTENSAKLNDMTSEELSQLFTALINRVITLYGTGFMNSNSGSNIQ